MNPAVFTAAQIAAALGTSRQGVQQALSLVREGGKQLVHGNTASAWGISSLPASMLAKLNRRAKAKGYRNAAHLLSEPPRRFESPVPVNQRAGPVQQRALKLRDALARPLAEQAQGLKGAALETLGLAEYQRVLGFEITARHWRALLSRAIDRDAGEENWSRLDLYLDERPHAAKRKKAAKVSPSLGDAEKILLGYAAQVREPSMPTTDEKAMLWNVAFDQTCELAQDGLTLRAARLAMRRVLWKCGVTLAKNETTLGQLWRTKEAAWREAAGDISALKDGRAAFSGNRRTPEIPQNDIDLVIAHGIKFGGRVSQAWRHVLENRLLSPQVQSYYELAFSHSKSWVPHAIRDAVTPEVRMQRDIHHGPRTADLNAAFITRDWSKVAAGDWYQSDDCTLPIYYIAPDERGVLSLIRGQFLPMIDVRSTCILGFILIDARNYNSHSIRTLITRTCDDHGLPRKGFYLEKGIWRTSKLLKGDGKAGKNELTNMESERGLLELGLKFVHARLPRGKPIERVLGQIQNLLDGEPGDAGRDEMKDKFERLQERKRLVESGHEPASKWFYTHTQWTERLVHICEEYNNARNDGAMTGGLTPFQAWEKFQTDPLVKLPPEARYLLAHHKRPVLVGRNGIVLRFGKKNFIYRNAETGKLRGQRVLAWFDPELPELLAVTDMNRENCFTVERGEEVPAMDAPDDILHREMSRIAAHNGYARQRYRTLAKLADLAARPTIMDHDTAKLGREIAEQQEQILAQRKTREKRNRVGRAAMNDLGIPARPDDCLTPDEIEAAKYVQAERQKFLQEKP